MSEEPHVEVVRVLVYRGPKSWVEECFRMRGVVGRYALTREKQINEVYISEGVEVDGNNNV